MKLLEDIKKEEGFVGVVYKCPEGFDTIGYGTKLPITQDEATLLLQHRLQIFKQRIGEIEPFFYKLPHDKQDIILNMCYQIGVSGVLKFKNMWKALKEFDYITASEEMLNSRWAIQTQKRAIKQAESMRGI